MTDTDIAAFKQYRRSQIAELRPYIEGEYMRKVSISDEDHRHGSPKLGDMIARNPKNHDDQWLVAAKYFSDNFEPVERLTTSGGDVEERSWERCPYCSKGLMAFHESESGGKVPCDAWTIESPPHACCEGMREKAAKVASESVGKLPNLGYNDDDGFQNSGCYNAWNEASSRIALAIRALPLTVSAEGRDAVTEEAIDAAYKVMCSHRGTGLSKQYFRDDVKRALQAALNSKQRSTTPEAFGVQPRSHRMSEGEK